MNSGLDIVSLPSHTSHALQPLDVSYFKPFKSAFRIRDCSTLLNKGRKVEKQDLCKWTAQALQKALSSKNIRSGFRKTGIWPLNPDAVRTQMLPSEGFEEGQEGFQQSQQAYDLNDCSEDDEDPDQRDMRSTRKGGSVDPHALGVDQGLRSFDRGEAASNQGERASDLGPNSLV
jgi:hypothetical protein